MTYLSRCIDTVFGVVCGDKSFVQTFIGAHDYPILVDPRCPKTNVYFIDEKTFKSLEKKIEKERY